MFTSAQSLWNTEYKWTVQWQSYSLSIFFFFSILTAFPNSAFSTGANSLCVLGYAWLATNEVYYCKYAFGYNSLVNFETRPVAQRVSDVVREKSASFQAQMGTYFEFPLIFNFVFIRTNSNTMRSLTWSRKPTTRSSVGMRPGKPTASTAIPISELISLFQSVRNHSIFRTFGCVTVT